MKITYTPNPLNTIIELDDHEVEVFKLKLKIRELEEMIFTGHFYLNEKCFDLDKARDELDPEYLDTKMDTRVDELFEHFISELQSNHVGDCTCFAMSCSKCHAEDMLGLDTIKGLGKHAGHKIQAAFNYKENDVWKTRSIDEAIAVLKNYDPVPKDPSYLQYADRWAKENQFALTWLEAYKEEHGL